MNQDTYGAWRLPPPADVDWRAPVKPAARPGPCAAFRSAVTELWRAARALG